MPSVVPNVVGKIRLAKPKIQKSSMPDRLTRIMELANFSLFEKQPVQAIKQFKQARIRYREAQEFFEKVSRPESARQLRGSVKLEIFSGLTKAELQLALKDKPVSLDDRIANMGRAEWWHRKTQGAWQKLGTEADERDKCVVEFNQLLIKAGHWELARKYNADYDVDSDSLLLEFEKIVTDMRKLESAGMDAYDMLRTGEKRIQEIQASNISNIQVVDELSIDGKIENRKTRRGSSVLTRNSN